MSQLHSTTFSHKKGKHLSFEERVIFNFVLKISILLERSQEKLAVHLQQSRRENVLIIMMFRLLQIQKHGQTAFLVGFQDIKLQMNYSKMSQTKSIKWMLFKKCPTCYCNLEIYLPVRNRRNNLFFWKSLVRRMLMSKLMPSVMKQSKIILGVVLKIKLCPQKGSVRKQITRGCKKQISAECVENMLIIFKIMSEGFEITACCSKQCKPRHRTRRVVTVCGKPWQLS